MTIRALIREQVYRAIINSLDEVEIGHDDAGETRFGMVLNENKATDAVMRVFEANAIVPVTIRAAESAARERALEEAAKFCASEFGMDRAGDTCSYVERSILMNASAQIRRLKEQTQEQTR